MRRVGDWQLVAAGLRRADAALLHVIRVRKRLPPPIRESILTLVFAEDGPQ